MDRLSVRRDPLSGRETIYAAARRNRPHQYSGDRKATGSAAPCPFCPGNETMLPAILWQEGEGDGWLVRAVPNLYPIVAPPDGHHEVIVETPHHAWPSEGMTKDAWCTVLGAYAIRYGFLSRDWRHVSLFRNVGGHAGGSLEHPHSQVIALAHRPVELIARRRRLRDLYRKSGRCALCAMIDTTGNGHLVTRNDSYAAIVPSGAEVPCEVWIVPTVHKCHFDFPRPDEKAALAGLLANVLGRMESVLGAFDHNMILMDSGPDPQPWSHWFFRLRPVLGPGGGFEVETGMSVNSSLPARDAAMLREARPKSAG